MAEKTEVVRRRKISKSLPATFFRENIQERRPRPISMELETDFSNTETKLVVLDFLSSQPIEHLTARNKRRTSEIPTNLGTRKLSKSSSDSLDHESYRYRYEKLAKSGRTLRKQYSTRLHKDLNKYFEQRGKSYDDLSKSIHGAMVDEEKKVPPATLQSSTPKRKMSRDLKEDIAEFDVKNLRHVVVPESETHLDDTTMKQNRPGNLNLPVKQERRLSPVLSPESQVAYTLERISKEILDEYPDLFNEPISRVSLQDLTYEKFASVARKVIEKYPGGWTRIALVCYFARELALEDESSDDQLDSLVNFSSRFIFETSAEWIASQGGWAALDDSETLSPKKVREKLKQEPDIIDGLLYGQPTTTWFNYVKYGMAALAVGMTVAYNVAK